MERFAVLTLSPDRPIPPVEPTVAAVAPILELHPYDVRAQLRRSRGILFEGLSESAAERVAEVMGGLGVQVEVTATELLPSVPRPLTLYYLDPAEEGLYLGRELALGEGIAAYERLQIIGAGLLWEAPPTASEQRSIEKNALLAALTAEERVVVRTSLQQNAESDTEGGTKTPPRHPLADLPAWLAEVDAEAFADLAPSLPTLLIDLILDVPPTHYRAEAATLIASPLGPARTPNWLLNGVEFLRRLVAESPETVTIMPGVRRLLALPDPPLPDATDALWRDLVFRSRIEYDAEIQWCAFQRSRQELEDW